MNHYGHTFCLTSPFLDFIIIVNFFPLIEINHGCQTEMSCIYEIFKFSNLISRRLRKVEEKLVAAILVW